MPCWWRRWTLRRCRHSTTPTLVPLRCCGQIQAFKRPTTDAESTSCQTPQNSEYTCHHLCVELVIYKYQLYMHAFVYPQNLHEIKNDPIYFPNMCSWWYYKWLIGACSFIVKHFEFCHCLLILMPFQTRVTLFLLWTAKGDFSPPCNYSKLEQRLSGLQKFDFTHVL